MTSRRTMRFALIGKSGAGKSTAAEILSNICDARSVSTGKICRDISRLLMGNEDKASTQKIDDALTKIDPSIFLKAALRDIPDTDAICIDSLRFKSDLKIARERGFCVIRITAPDEIRIQRLKVRGQTFNLGTDGSHQSENELDNAEVDFEICNDRSQDAMRLVINSIYVTQS